MKTGAKSPRRRAVLRGKQRGGLGRGFTQYDHGQPIKTIDTRPMAFVFGLVALVMLFASTPTYPAGTQALLIELPSGWHPRKPIEDIEPPPIFEITIDAGGQTFNKGKAISLDALKNDLSAVQEATPIISFTPDPNANYATVLKTLGVIDQLGLTSPWQFCFRGNAEHRTFDKGLGGSLQIMAAIAPPFEREANPSRYMPEPEPHFFKVCYGQYTWPEVIY